MLKREIDKTKTIFRRQKKIKLKYINAPKIEYNKQMCQLILNARVFVKQEINNITLYTIFSEKFPNQFKEQTNSKVSLNILSSYKASS